ncbi:MAG: hypothetical protein ACREKK_08760 [Candidatus Methylomirabilales bacterium]
MVKPLWKDYSVTWQFLGLLCGSVPQDPDLVRKWLESRRPKAKPPQARSLEDVQREVLETVAEPEVDPEISVVGFQRFNGVLVLRAGTIRSHLKEAARALSVHVVGKVEGERSFGHRFQVCVYPPPEDYWLPIWKAGSEAGIGTVTEPDGWIEKPFSAMTARGPISAFKRFAYVERPWLRFRLRVLGGAVSLADLQSVMDYGGTHGYGGERGVGEGRYRATITES